jgi:hypothetical protein
MKPELRKALETELERLNGRVRAIRLLLETPETPPTAHSPRDDKVREPEKTDGRKLRWQKATPEQKKAWANAIRIGRKSRKAKRR